MRDEEYEIRVEGPVSAAVLAEFEGLEGLVATVEPASTVLHARGSDQAALHGILARLRGLGLDIVEVRRITFSDQREG